ncbi:hypothetical protein [Variovorax sp. LT1P1]|uniref:hypothetical protein n=1 Tax=Variovorax sp. LT1P1 TaxID=3443730 RepID=UPI003F491DF8
MERARTTAGSLQAAVYGAKAIFQPGFNYAKAGVMLLDLQDASVEQQELALDDRSALMETMDRLNERYGGIDRAGQQWEIERAADLDDEAVIEDAGVHDAVGGGAAGDGSVTAGKKNVGFASIAVVGLEANDV